MNFYLGIDIGSTTVKLVLFDENENIIYKSYQRHFSKTLDTLENELKKIIDENNDINIKVAMTGSGGMELANNTKVPFVQEVFATSLYVDTKYPEIDVAIELGGEDAKIIFFGVNTEEKMNGTCAGGTGAFIDQMATLLNVTPQQMDELSLKATATYPIASRCGVFAKSDVQPLLNQGASKENISASVYNAVAEQTIGGLAGGHPIEGNVLFLGGPLTFCEGLRKAFMTHLKDVTPVFLDDAEYFVAFSTAFYASRTDGVLSLCELLKRVQKAKTNMKNTTSTCKALFKNKEEYDEFVKRHNTADVEYDNELKNTKYAFIGIDAGSTTTKTVAINQDNQIIFTAYDSNKGNPVETVKNQLTQFYDKCRDIPVYHSVVTGYGEELIKNAFKIDYGVVETMAHYNGAKFFEPDVDFIIDIGGQDMKCFGIKNKNVDSITLNEACSSGCGSFLQSFAKSMGHTITEFESLALASQNPVDLGSRCTVFMNSSVKQAQKNGASIEDISAGLAISVVKNALFKVLRVNDAKQIGEKIVVQGGTFTNDAVLRAFEQLLGANVIRPSIAGLMGAFGCALLAKQQGKTKSTISTMKDLENFSHTSTHTRCNLCKNHCALTINKFSDNTKFISGNRCTRPLRNKNNFDLPNIYKVKQDYLAKYFIRQNDNITIGIPLVLNFYDNLPFWVTLFDELGFSVKVSGFSNRDIYRDGQHTIPSDTVCYCAKLVHGHIIKLVEEEKVDAIFYPCMSYNKDEGKSNNHYHCPIVAYYPQTIKANVSDINKIDFLSDFLDLNNEKNLSAQLLNMLLKYDKKLNKRKILKAIKKANAEQENYRQNIITEGKKARKYAYDNNINTIVLAGRPYHLDPELNHSIDKMISSLGFVVLSEDSLDYSNNVKDIGVLNQWTYHSRMYQAAKKVINMKNTELVQLISFGCGLDAITSDEIKEILVQGGKLYTGLKIDEINNLGTVKIRMRSLLVAMEERGKQ